MKYFSFSGFCHLSQIRCFSLVESVEYKTFNWCVSQFYTLLVVLLKAAWDDSWSMKVVTMFHIGLLKAPLTCSLRPHRISCRLFLKSCGAVLQHWVWLFLIQLLISSGSKRPDVSTKHSLWEVRIDFSLAVQSWGSFPGNMLLAVKWLSVVRTLRSHPLTE